jgi:hypothetical protein
MHSCTEHPPKYLHYKYDVNHLLVSNVRRGEMKITDHANAGQDVEQLNSHTAGKKVRE